MTPCGEIFRPSWQPTLWCRCDRPKNHSGDHFGTVEGGRWIDPLRLAFEFFEGVVTSMGAYGAGGWTAPPTDVPRGTMCHHCHSPHVVAVCGIWHDVYVCADCAATHESTCCLGTLQPHLRKLRGSSVINPWLPSRREDWLAVSLADRHYTRQSHGNRRWCRPGYNYVLVTEDGGAVWCWWRPKWEAGINRMDGLRALECTMFRRERGPLASVLVESAVDALAWTWAKDALHLANAGEIAMLITGISSSATNARRGRTSLPGHCYRVAGWVPFGHRTGVADIWLRATR